MGCVLSRVDDVGIIVGHTIRILTADQRFREHVWGLLRRMLNCEKPVGEGKGAFICAELTASGRCDYKNASLSRPFRQGYGPNFDNYFGGPERVNG